MSGPRAEGPLSRALWGARQLVDGARLVATDPRLRAAAIPPPALTFLGSALLALLLAERRGGGGVDSPLAPRAGCTAFL